MLQAAMKSLWRRRDGAVRRAVKSDFVKAVGLSSVVTALRMLLGIVSTKVVAVYAGPAGIAMIGQLQNFLTLTGTIGQGGITQGIVKYVAEYRDEPAQEKSLLATSVQLTAVFSLVVAVATLLFSDTLAEELLGDRSSAYLFWLCSFVTFFGAFAGIVGSALHGRMMYGRLTVMSMISIVAGFAITLPLTVLYHTKGAVAAIILTSLFSSALVYVAAFGLGWMRLGEFRDRFSAVHFKALMHYAVMALVSGIAGPVSLILIRRHLIDDFSIDAAGLWQSVWRISDIYIQIVTIPLGTYYLPRLSAVKSLEGLRPVIMRGSLLIVPVTAIMGITIYLSRDLIIHLLFTSAFAEVRDLFAFQLVGDFLKISSWMISTVMVARSMTKTFIITDVGFTASFYLLVVVMTNQFGLVGASYAFALNYLIYLITMVVIFRGIFWPRPTGDQRVNH